MDWLNEILKDIENKEEIIKQIKKGIGTNFVAKSDFNAKNEELKKQIELLSERDKQLETLKNSVDDSEKLKNDIAELQRLNKEAQDKYNADLKELQLNSAIKLALNGKVHDEDIVSNLIDRSKIVLSDGKVVGLDEQLNSLKEAKSFLFVSENADGGFKGATPESGGGTPSKPLSEMTYDDFLASVDDK